MLQGETSSTNSATNGAAGEAADVESALESAAEASSRRRRVLLVAGAAVAGAVAVAAASSRATVSGPVRDESEPISMRLRPRKVAWRYLTTLGLWEGARRRTRYTLTDRHLVVEKGFVHRRVDALPLHRVTDVAIRTGRWQGFVDVAASGRHGATLATLGPLRTPVARRLGAAVASAAYRVR